MSIHPNTSNNIIPFSGRLGAEALLTRIRENEANCWTAQCRGMTLSSVFQPIISLNHRRVVGHEALLRTHDNQNKTISPALLFNSRENIEEVIELDRLCRVLHSSNYQQHPHDNGWLFLNINPDVINHGHKYGPFFSQLLDETGLAASQIVVEVLENQVSDEALLRESIDYYRQIGCLIAIDDFGAGHSNIDRVLHMEPDIVKLDQSLLNNTSAKAKRILTNLVSLLHEAGCLVVLEGIETLEQTLLAYEIDVDFVQGFFFSLPATQPVPQLPENFFPQIDIELEKHQKKSSDIKRNTLAYYHSVFEQSIAHYESGHDFSRSAKELLGTDGIQRTYLMDEQGFLIGENFYSKKIQNTLRPQMAPIHISSGANLGNRHYFRRAINHPGHIQTTRPYLSTTDAQSCITLSRRVEINGKIEVICCDMEVV